jgi:hypothetical protein
MSFEPGDIMDGNLSNGDPFGHDNDDPLGSNGDPFGSDALDSRLRTLSWPEAPADVKRRCLEAVIRAASDAGALTGDGSELLAAAQIPETDPADRTPAAPKRPRQRFRFQLGDPDR